jgi:glycosyltransferase involved in cell wall biosynthesis
MPTPFFSIVIPTYNRANLILKTLESVFNQSWQDFEIIVVDNCSTDDTEQVLKPFIDARKIIFIKHDMNYERAVSRNTGMKAARGRFLTLLDSDDLMYRDNLADAHQFVVDNPELHLFQNKYELIDTNGTVLYHYPFPSLKNPIRAIARGNFISCIGIFLSTEVYSRYQFDTSEIVQGIEDWEFWLRVLSEFRIGRMEKINSGIVHHGGRSITQYSLNSFIEKKDYVLAKMAADPKLKVIYSPYFHEFNASCYLLASSMANGAGLFDESRVYLHQAFQINKGLLLRPRFWRILQVAFFRIKSKI